MRSWIPILVVTAVLPGAAGAATRLDGFPVQLEGTADAAPPLALDLDGDGRLEIVAASRTQLAAFEADGSPVQGFPVSLPKGQGPATPLCAGPWGGPRPTLFWITPVGGLMAVEGDGRPRPGFPLEVGRATAAPALIDVDGDGGLEAVVGGGDGQLYAFGQDGKAVANFPAVVGTPVTTAVTAGRLSPEGEPLLLFGDEKGRLHAWTRARAEAAGFPYTAGAAISTQPVLGDIDDDGRFELVFGSMDFQVHAVKADGSAVAGFPVKTGYRVYATCALADLTGDGVVEVLATSGDGMLHAVDGSGRPLAGFPVRVGNRPHSAPVVGDVDADGKAEIAVGSDQGRLFVLRANGKDYPGFPVSLGQPVDSAPLLADLGGAGSEQLFVLSHGGSLAAFKFLRKGKAVPRALWPAEARDAARAGRTGPNLPRFAALAIEPERPSTLEPLRLRYRFFDLDGDPEPATRVRWYRDGKPEASLDGERVVPAEATRKHQRWHFTLQADEGERIFQSPEVEIGNTAPTAPKLRLSPDPARTDDEIALQVARPSEDPDGDRVSYRVTWLRDREPVKGLKGMVVAAKLTRKGQRWTAVVTPNDGEVDGPPERASLVVANSIPSAPRVRLIPDAPTVTQPVEVRIEQPGRDPDGDPVRYLVRWTAGGRELALPADSLALPPGLAPKKSEILATVTAFDGTDSGGQVEARAVVRNTPPSAPRLAIYPTAPRRGDTLEACVVGEAADPDRDPVTLRLAWSRQGKPLAGALATAIRLPPGEGRKGERFTLCATPWDGEASGPPARVEVALRNSPPEKPILRAVEPRPRTDADLVLELAAPLSDADGDRVELDVVWLEDGREVARGPGMLRLPAARTRKHASYVARATPRDGEEQGPVGEAWFEVQNSPPGACQVAIEPARPRTGVGLRARLVTPPVDPDGDPVKLRYAWFRDDQPLARSEAVEGREVHRGQRWVLRVVPSDGEEDGPSCQAEAVVENQPPEPPRPVLEPASPRATDALTLRFASPPRDPDGDPVALAVSWSVDGQGVPGGAERVAVPAGVLRKGQRWAVEVVASDGTLASPAGRAEVMVVNSPPEAPRLLIQPAAPSSSDDLFCLLAQATADPDGDAVLHTFGWTLAASAKEPGSRLPGRLTERGQRWMCTAVASDGALESEMASTFVEIGNAAPGDAGVDLQPASPGDDDELRCVIARPATDPDGDALRYKVRWTKDGVVQPFAEETETVPARLTRPRDIWQCSVVATDGKAEGPASSSPEVIIR